MTDRRRTRTPNFTTTEARPAERRRWTLAGVRALGATTDVVTAGQIIGLSRNTNYRLVRAGAFPVPVIKAGRRYRVPVPGLLTALGDTTAGPANGHTTYQKRPKIEAGNREVVLDPHTVAVLSAYKARRAAWRLAAGADWPDTGLFFVRRDGRAWHPNSITQRFRRLVKQAGLPPVRLHDLRHGAATLALGAGIDVKVVSEQLGHSTTTLTRDTYQSVVKRMHHEAADAVAERIKIKRRRTA